MILHNMVVEIRKNQYNFTDLADIDDAEDGQESDDEESFTLFGFDGGGHNKLMQEAMSGCISTMQWNIEDGQKHAVLQADLLIHINKRGRGYLFYFL